MDLVWIVEFWAEGRDFPSDCHGDFLATREEAVTVGEAEIARVAAIPSAQREPRIDWAVRYTLRQVDLADEAAVA